MVINVEKRKVVFQGLCKQRERPAKETERK